LAAQNGHVAATSLLLQLGCPINTGTGATPLHRASFSGAVATMRVLLHQSSEISDSDCDMLLARDTSFGDEMTPLHKAAAGGRYLGVQLLLEVLREQTTLKQDAAATATTTTNTSLFRQALQARDKCQRTPLDVAIELRRRQEEERQSVARWDQVAGGVADWGKCIELLRAAEAEISSKEVAEKSTTTTTAQQQPWMQLPDHLVRVNKDGCIDCGPSTTTADNGQCLTASWQAAFQAALGNSVDLLLLNDKPPSQQQTRLNTAAVNEPPTVVHRATTTASDNSPVAKVDVESTNSTGSRSGISCSLCGKLSVALYPMASGSLMCKTCKRSGAA
jgi:hypothetical protein